MAGGKAVDSNNNSEENGAETSSGTDGVQQVKAEAEEFDVSDCFTDDVDEERNTGSVKREFKKNDKLKNGGATIVISDDEGSSDNSQDSLDTKIKRTLAKAEEFSVKEDPDIVRIKKDLYANPAEIDYELDFGDEDEKIPEEALEVVVKQEPVSPVKRCFKQLKIDAKHIPTIDLSSDEEEVKLLKKDCPVQASSSRSSVKRTRSERSINSRKTRNSDASSSLASLVDDKKEPRRKRGRPRKQLKPRDSSSDCYPSKESIEKRKSLADSTSFAVKSSPEHPVESVVDQEGIKPEGVTLIGEPKPDRRESEESDQVKNTIAKELHTQIAADGDCDQKDAEEEPDLAVTTDIALEDLLEFLDGENISQNPSQILFPTDSAEEEKLILKSSLVESEKVLIAELENILKDDNLPSENNAEEPLFNITITLDAAAAVDPIGPELTDRCPKPRFRLVFGKPSEPPKKRGRPPKIPIPPPKKNRRYESDEEYIPSFARTRRIPLRKPTKRRSCPRKRANVPVAANSVAAVQPVVAQSPIAAEDGVYKNMPSLEEDLANAAKAATELASASGGAVKKSTAKRRKKRRISSSSEDETTAESVSLGGDTSTTTPSRSTTTMDDEEPPAQEEESSHEPDPVGSDLDSTAGNVTPVQTQTKEMLIVLTPLEETLKRINSKELLPKNMRPQSKATQTEVEGMTWSIDVNRIDFNSDYFNKLYQTIHQGKEQQNRNQPSDQRNSLNNFEGVVMAGRDIVGSPTPPAPPTRASPPPRSSTGARSNVEQLLFQRRIDEIPIAPTVRVEQRDRDRMERSVMFNFRIPKVVKQASSSPQDVTSSTPHEHEPHYKEEDQRATDNDGAVPSYSNDRPAIRDPRRDVAAGRSSPLRFGDDVTVGQRFGTQNEQPNAASDNPRPFTMRRTIHNDHIQQQQQPAAAQPVQNGFPAYEPKYENNFQPPQQQRGFVPPQQEMDIKPNLSTMAGQLAMFANPSIFNPPRYFEAYNYLCQMTQLLQQQLQFPLIPNPGLMFPAQSVPATNFANFVPPQMMQPHAPEPSTSGAGQRYVREPMAPDVGCPAPVAAARSNEQSEQISQIFGCYDQLTGKCNRNPCPYSHALPVQSNVFRMLTNQPQELVMSTYRFIAERENLFLCYFPVYTKVMGRANLRHQLVDTIADCERKRAFHFYRHIVDGLTLNGTLSRDKAVKIVLEKHTKKNFDQVNMLVQLILDGLEETPLFLQWLEDFSRVQGYSFEIVSINRLMECCVRASGPNALDASVVNVAKLTYRLLLEVAAGREPEVNSDMLLKFAQLLRQSNVGLNVENIIRKYRANEMFDRR